jgi:hypothetical protein
MLIVRGGVGDQDEGPRQSAEEIPCRLADRSSARAAQDGLSAVGRRSHPERRRSAPPGHRDHPPRLGVDQRSVPGARFGTAPVPDGDPHRTAAEAWRAPLRNGERLGEPVELSGIEGRAGSRSRMQTKALIDASLQGRPGRPGGGCGGGPQAWRTAAQICCPRPPGVDDLGAAELGESVRRRRRPGGAGGTASATAARGPVREPRGHGLRLSARDRAPIPRRLGWVHWVGPSHGRGSGTGVRQAGHSRPRAPASP